MFRGKFINQTKSEYRMLVVLICHFGGMPLFVKVNVRYLFLPIFPQLLPHFYQIVDISCYHNDYHGDLNETLFVGNVDEDSKILVKTAYDSMMAGLDAGILQEGTFNYYICI